MRISDWSSDVCSSDLTRLCVRTAERSPSRQPRRKELPSPFTFHAESRSPSQFVDQQRYESNRNRGDDQTDDETGLEAVANENGRASCRERGWQYVLSAVVNVTLKKKKTKNDNS